MERAEIIEKFKAAVTTGQPRRETLFDSADRDGMFIHPLFSLMEMSDPEVEYDKGFTGNPHRGDHLTIPCMAEDGQIFTIEVSFHKGAAIVDLVRFEGVDEEAGEAAENAVWDNL